MSRKLADHALAGERRSKETPLNRSRLSSIVLVISDTPTETPRTCKEAGRFAEVLLGTKTGPFLSGLDGHWVGSSFLDVHATIQRLLEPAGVCMPKSLEITAIFGGIGGLELGLHRSGHRTSLFCECDPEATTVLQHQFAGVPIVSDIKQTDEVLAKISPTSNLLTAGFPCTDLSQAGQTRGFAGGRSSLIRETIELLRRRPFPNVLIENVPNWRHLHKGEYMAEVLSALEGLGYRWAYRTIDALAFGLPQRRNRIFVFATLEGDPRRVLFHGNHAPVEGEKSLTESAHGFYWTEGTRGLGWGEDCIPTMKGGSAMGIPSPPAILLPDLSVITPSANDAERLQGFPDGWTDFEGVVDENGRVFNKRRRWMLIGNAVNVAVSTWLGEQLATQRPYEGEPGTPLVEGKSWPAAAWFDGKVRYEVPIGAWPVNEDRQPLARFLNHSGTPLSLRATAGFYKRICESTLRFKPGFKEAIAAHLKRMEAFTIIATPKAPKKPAVESVEMA